MKKTENVILVKNYAYFKDGEWHPVKGWTWANPDNPRDRRVKKIEETKK